MNKIKSVVIPVAGMGTRFLPATKVVPKEMLAILDRPLLDYAVSEAIDAGIENFIFVINKDNYFPRAYLQENDKLEKYLINKNKKTILKKIVKLKLSSQQIKTVVQSKPLGLGHAILMTQKFLAGQDFAVILPDDLILGKNCLKELIDVYSKKNSSVLAVMEVERKNISKYGIIKPLEKGNKTIQISSLVEKPASNPPSNLGVVGRYILRNTIFSQLRKKKIGSGGEIQLTDAISSITKKEPVFAFRLSGNTYDCGSKKGFFQAQIACALRDKDLKIDIRKIFTNEFAKVKGFVK